MNKIILLSLALVVLFAVHVAINMVIFAQDIIIEDVKLKFMSMSLIIIPYVITDI